MTDPSGAGTGLRRLPIVLRPDPAQVLLRPFLPGPEPRPVTSAPGPVVPATEIPQRGRPEPSRLTRVTGAVAALDPAEVDAQLAAVMRDFGSRHTDLRAILADRFVQVCGLMAQPPAVPEEARRLLIGAYFTLEYSYQAAALFNPSIVPHPDQGGLVPGELRFVLSLRATGEGHVSSICFRSGVVDAACDIRLDPPGTHPATPQWNSQVDADGGCEVGFRPEGTLAERVLFPITPNQRNGLEDARFVRFVEDDGTVAYYATYTAYSGQAIAPELLRTQDFRQFLFLPLHGEAVRNKGMALFPRRIDGRYVMLLRLDGESLQLSRSDDLQSWSDVHTVFGPAESWDLVQIGNCGSPIELPEGWLLITHGVGPMRRYALGAALLDLHDPTRVLARLRTPLLTADASEREGYVPNVVYSCGALLHAGHLVLPYAMADSATGFAVVPIDRLLAAMS